MNTAFCGFLAKAAKEPAVWDTALRIEDLPAGEVLVRVRYAALNYKDALALTAKAPVLRSFPIIPGVELAGEVIESGDPRFRPGDQVMAMGRGIGDQRSGSLAQLARVPAEAVHPVSPDLPLHEAVGAGAAAFTAMLCVLALEAHDVAPGDGEVVVTGACGGVGGYAVALLSARGHAVAAVTGRPSEAPYLERLGARRIVDRATLAKPGKALAKETWAGAVDTVGGPTLANLLAQIRYGGSVAACGNAGGAELPTTVFPFILRAVNLLGIDAVHCPAALREKAMRALMSGMPRDAIAAMCQVRPMTEALAIAGELLAGRVRGRVVLEAPV